MQRLFRIFGIFCLTSSLWGPVGRSAGDLDAGNAAYAAGDYATALDAWKAAAQGGSAAAEFNVGLLYFGGNGVGQDHAEAARWFERAADRGFARAQYRLGDLYERGDGVERDEIRAYTWFKLASQQNYENAKKRRKKVADRMSPHDISLGEMHAREWSRKAGQTGAKP